MAGSVLWLSHGVHRWCLLPKPSDTAGAYVPSLLASFRTLFPPASSVLSLLDLLCTTRILEDFSSTNASLVFHAPPPITPPHSSAPFTRETCSKSRLCSPAFTSSPPEPSLSHQASSPPHRHVSGKSVPRVTVLHTHPVARVRPPLPLPRATFGRGNTFVTWPPGH